MIDWAWVEKELFEKERIPAISKDGLKHIIHTSLDRAIKESKALAKPKRLSLTKKIVKIKPNSIELDGSIIFSGKRLSSYVKGATDLHLFLVTIGGETEKKASFWMSRGEPLYGYLLDRIGSFAVESLAQAMERNLRQKYLLKGRSVSMRLSPGYCDWPIEEQFIMKKILDFSKIGVSLTKNCMMVPKKSISAMVAIGPKDLFTKTREQCAICDKKDCDHRRITG